MAYPSHMAEYYRLRAVLERAMALGANSKAERAGHLKAADRFEGMAGVSNLTDNPASMGNNPGDWTGQFKGSE